MKKIILIALPVLLNAGWYFYVRFENNGRAGGIIYTRERVTKYCNDGVASKKTYLDGGSSERDVDDARERTAKLKKWAVSQEKLDRIATAQQTAEKAVAVCAVMHEHLSRLG